MMYALNNGNKVMCMRVLLAVNALQASYLSTTCCYYQLILRDDYGF